MRITRPSEGSRRVLLTGASSGIGAALARRLAARGDRLALVARRIGLLEDLADQIAREDHQRPFVFAADLSVNGAAAAVAERALAGLGGIDLLVNNAGGGAGGTMWRAADRPEAREAFEVNYWSPLALLSAVVPRMIEQSSGVIVNVTSLGQVMTWPLMGPYTSTKAALASATETLRLELNGTGVHVVEVVPGPVATAVQGEGSLLPGFAQAVRRAPVGDPDALARRIVRAVDRRRARLVYPRPLLPAYVLPGLTRSYIATQSRRLAVGAAYDHRVLRSGSLGDPEARAARERWERGMLR